MSRHTDQMLTRRAESMRDFTRAIPREILNPTSDRTHDHLIYGTHSDEGLVVFREIERRV